METIAERLQHIREGIAEAARRSGRKPGEIELVAVSKGHPAEAILQTHAAGQRLFGESRVQEALPKMDATPAGLRWHFLGGLQKNKVRRILPRLEMVESLDSLDLAASINRIAGEEDCQAAALLEINLGEETSKQGWSPQTLLEEAEELCKLSNLKIQGLMTIPPYSADAEDSRSYFVRLRELREELQRQIGRLLPHLSMGMSNDYQVAIEEGATLVRVGTALFGERSSSRV